MPLNMNIVSKIYFIEAMFEYFLKWSLKGKILVSVDNDPQGCNYFHAMVILILFLVLFQLRRHKATADSRQGSLANPISVSMGD